MTSMVTGVISITTHHHRFYGASINVTELIDSKDKLSSAIKNLEIFKIRRDQLLGMVAHEIRTPAASLSMLSNDGDQDAWISNQSHVQQQVSSLLSAIDDLKILVDGKLEKPVQLEPVDIVHLSEDIAQCVSSLVAATGLHFDNICAVPDSLSKRSFRLDAYRTRLAVSSLIKNSCLNSQASDVWMITRIKQSKDSSRYIEWVVWDNGTGIDLDSIKPAEGECVGLPSIAGLGIKDIEAWIIDLGGRVEYTTTKEGGAEYRIQIPLIETETETETEILPLLKKLTVLFVEDDLTIRLLGEKLLSNLVGEVYVAKDGLDGLDQCSIANPDLILTDYFMPNMTGAEMASSLRKMGFKAPIVGVTAATIGNQIDELLSSGVDMVLSKPLTSKSLIAAISQLMASGKLKKVGGNE